MQCIRLLYVFEARMNEIRHLLNTITWYIDAKLLTVYKRGGVKKLLAITPIIVFRLLKMRITDPIGNCSKHAYI